MEFAAPPTGDRRLARDSVDIRSRVPGREMPHLRQSMPDVGMLSSEFLERLREKVRA
jgi:hypothetical protein